MCRAEYDVEHSKLIKLLEKIGAQEVAREVYSTFENQQTSICWKEITTLNFLSNKDISGYVDTSIYVQAEADPFPTTNFSETEIYEIFDTYKKMFVPKLFRTVFANGNLTIKQNQTITCRSEAGYTQIYTNFPGRKRVEIKLKSSLAKEKIRNVMPKENISNKQNKIVNRTNIFGPNIDQDQIVFPDSKLQNFSHRSTNPNNLALSLTSWPSDYSQSKFFHNTGFTTPKTRFTEFSKINEDSASRPTYYAAEALPTSRTNQSLFYATQPSGRSENGYNSEHVSFFKPQNNQNWQKLSKINKKIQTVRINPSRDNNISLSKNHVPQNAFNFNTPKKQNAKLEELFNKFEANPKEQKILDNLYKFRKHPNNSSNALRGGTNKTRDVLDKIAKLKTASVAANERESKKGFSQRIALANSNETNNANPAQATQFMEPQTQSPIQISDSNSQEDINKNTFVNDFSNCSKASKILLNINVSISNGIEPSQILEKYVTIDLNKTLPENANFNDASREIINNYYLEALSKYKNCIRKGDKTSFSQRSHSFQQNQQYTSRSVVQPYGYVMKKDDKYFVIPSDQVAFYNMYG